MISKYVLLNRSYTVVAAANITSYLKYTSWLCNYDSLLELFETLRLSIFMVFCFTLIFEEMGIIICQGHIAFSRKQSNIFLFKNRSIWSIALGNLAPEVSVGIQENRNWGEHQRIRGWGVGGRLRNRIHHLCSRSFP